MSTDYQATSETNAGSAEMEQSLLNIVGIGASAGGIRSLERLFEQLELGTGSAFIVIQHFSPDIDSSMDDILGRQTELEIRQIEDGTRLSADTVFLMPPGKQIRLEGDTIRVFDQDRQQIIRPIDVFFSSLADNHGDRAIGIVLSGTGSDGAEGIAAIHAGGGTTFCESPESAQFDGMPRNAIATDCVDEIMLPEEIAQSLNRRFENPGARPPLASELAASQLTGINLVFSLLSRRHEVDFSQYKPSTVARRIERRQQISRCKTVLEYAQLVKQDVVELDLLYHDLLIGVTKFFRDTEVFAVVEKEIHQQIRSLPANEEYRVWSAGCATGEEPYSLAMIIHEAFIKSGRELKYKIFATDIHQGSLDAASHATYTSECIEFVSADRRAQFFTPDDDDRFRISSDLRHHMVFARHNVFDDPPFTRLNLVSCRNLLIYLQPKGQSKAIASFHFGLKPDGILLLGTSETPGTLADEFKVVQENAKVFRKIRNLPAMIDSERDFRQRPDSGPRRLVNLLNRDRPESLSFTSLVESYDLILQEFINCGLLLDENRNVVHVFGDASRYLNRGSGRFSGNLMDLLGGDARAAIGGALIQAGREPGKRILLESIELGTDDDRSEKLDLGIRALSGTPMKAPIWFIEFHAAREQDSSQADDKNIHRVSYSGDAYSALESELLYTRENLNATIEELEASNEELQAANEELVASNEELQSTNEELHSVNEELYSVNAENQRKIGELEEMTNDVDNLLASTDIGTIFLDSRMCVRKFTKASENFIKLMPADIGREISDFATHVDLPDLHLRIREVIESGDVFEKEVSNRDGGNIILVRILPYLSGQDVTGAIVNFVGLAPRIASIIAGPAEEESD